MLIIKVKSQLLLGKFNFVVIYYLYLFTFGYIYEPES
jgi:hypothetical protein